MTSNLVHSFVFGKPSGRGKNSPEKGRIVSSDPYNI